VRDVQRRCLAIDRLVVFRPRDLHNAFGIEGEALGGAALADSGELPQIDRHRCKHSAARCSTDRLASRRIGRVSHPSARSTILVRTRHERHNDRGEQLPKLGLLANDVGAPFGPRRQL
jgi:hypothetical protein